MKHNVTLGPGYYPDYPEKPFSDETMAILSLIVDVAAGGGLAFSGLITNTITIVIFHRQGPMSHSANVCLTALAASDWLVCFFSVWRSVCGLLYYGRFETPYWGWKADDFQIATGSFPKNIATQVTCLITAFLSLERVFSVTLPLKVKVMFTPKRSLVVIGCMWAYVCLIHIIPNIQWTLEWVRDDFYNVTYIGYVYSGLISQDVYRVYSITDPLIVRFSCIILVTVCNVIIYWKVSLSKKFKQKVVIVPSSKFKYDQNADTARRSGDPASCKKAKTNKADIDDVKEVSDARPANNGLGRSTKEEKLLRMITMVSVVFSLCYSLYMPYALILTTILQIGVDYHWYLDAFVYAVINFFQILNSSLNFFIFYSMSSRFKDEFQRLCARGTTS